ncbi:MAG: tRNA (uridine(34)/cytosine(34)/5-carboxymethylaminomethyluridine(34)-2'-O)-methyltransferase TrmL [Firmicutes bacterium]|nr:tRNA (uridine(34)/cytosine(34)/5-carboxymethylaminomethyluridine(34)-2'-O)-methyltransferase TrmL [Bacillota bacterium]
MDNEKEYLFNIVLVEPEIPPNTGNIARTCAITGAKLHLVKPLGFSIDSKMLKRAGLDYWNHTHIEIHENLDEFLEKYRNKKLYLATTHGGVRYTNVDFEADSFILFGKETAGLPKEFIADHPDTAIRIPMGNDPDLRSLNLSNAVAVVLYEALRQHDFPDLI